MSDSKQSSSAPNGAPAVTGSFSLVGQAATAVAAVGPMAGAAAQVAIARSRERTARHEAEQATERARIDAQRQIEVARIRAGQDGDRS